MSFSEPPPTLFQQFLPSEGKDKQTVVIAKKRAGKATKTNRSMKMHGSKRSPSIFSSVWQILQVVWFSLNLLDILDIGDFFTTKSHQGKREKKRVFNCTVSCAAKALERGRNSLRAHQQLRDDLPPLSSHQSGSTMSGSLYCFCSITTKGDCFRHTIHLTLTQ